MVNTLVAPSTSPTQSRQLLYTTAPLAPEQLQTVKRFAEDLIAGKVPRILVFPADLGSEWADTTCDALQKFIDVGRMNDQLILAHW